MSEYSYVVLVGHGGGKPFLFEAPSYPRLNTGDSVLCDTQNGSEQPGKCLSPTLYLGGDELDALITAARAKRPLRRVVGLVEVTKLQYKDESPDGADDTDEAMDG